MGNRWHVEITYRTGAWPYELLILEHDVEELHEVHALVELGPDWNAIEKIEITLARVTTPSQTIEKAAAS